MEREDNVILIVIKHHLGVRNIWCWCAFGDCLLVVVLKFTRYFEMYIWSAERKYKN